MLQGRDNKFLQEPQRNFCPGRNPVRIATFDGQTMLGNPGVKGFDALTARRESSDPKRPIFFAWDEK